MFTRFPPRLPELVKRARELSTEVTAAMPDCLAFVGGAPFAGLGTPTSDVDLFVLPPQSDQLPEMPEQIMFGNNRVDIEFVSIERFTESISRCERFTAAAADTSQIRYARQWVIDPIIRFALGEIVVDDGRLAALHERVRKAEPELAKLMVAELTTQVLNLATDIQGFVALNDWPAARHLAQIALISAAEARLVSVGDPYIGNKWVWARWQRSIGDRHGSELWQLLEDPAVPAESRRAVRCRLWAAQSLLCSAIVGLDDPLPADVAPDLPRRDPFVVPTPTTDAIFLYRPMRKALRISRQGLTLWSVAHGRSRAEAVAQTCHLLAEREQAVTEGDVGRYYDSLAEAGLIMSEEDVMVVGSAP